MIGLYGKIPTHGDFVRRDLPDTFVVPWDSWLQDCMLAARDLLQSGFSSAWEDAPTFRFRIAAGCCGDDAVAGIVLPSADLVGRPFPLTLARIIPGGETGPHPAWYDRLAAYADSARSRPVRADELAREAAALCEEGGGGGDLEPDGWWIGQERLWTGQELPPAREVASEWARKG